MEKLLVESIMMLCCAALGANNWSMLLLNLILNLEHFPLAAFRDSRRA